MIDNDLEAGTSGQFAFDVLAGGASGSNLGAGRGGISAKGKTMLIANEQVIFEYINYVDVGSNGDATGLINTTITMPPTLVAPDLVASEGEFDGENGTVRWRVESRLDDGVPTVVNIVRFESSAPLGNLRFINYLDEDVDSVSDDLLYLVGTPGQPEFRAFTLDNAQRVGFSQGGVYQSGLGLENATYDGWAADRFPQLRSAIEGGGASFSVEGNIDTTDLPGFPDPELGTVFGITEAGTGGSDVTTAFAWTVDADSSVATITSFVDLIPEVPSEICGQKFNDLNGNGMKDQGEPGLSGWTIELDLNDDGSVDDSTITDSEGNYAFPSVPPGTHGITEILQQGWIQTFPSTPGDYVVIAAEGNDVSGLDFGNFQLASISGTKFEDIDGDGSSVSDPPFLGGVQINLFLDVDDDGLFEPGGDDNGPVATIATNGTYAFSELGPGRYFVQEDTVSLAPLDLIQIDGGDDFGSGINFYTVLVTSGAERSANDFWNSLPDPVEGASLSGTVFNDENRDGRGDGLVGGEGSSGGGDGPVVVNTTNNNANALRDALLGTGVAGVGDATFVGSDLSAGFFSGGSSSIGISSGVVLATGDVTNANGPNQEDGFTSNSSSVGDADLDLEFSTTTLDTTSLTFDFDTDGGDLFFNFVFATEEYNEFANSTFNDVFGFFVDEVNIAMIPGTTTPISVNTINGGHPFGTDAVNSQFFINNDLDDNGGFLSEFGYDGFTNIFTAQSRGLGSGTHTIKLAISDVGDMRLDAAVFLEAGSFQDVAPEPDPGIGGKTVFLDEDGDRILDPDEMQTTTGPDGTYMFDDVPAGSYTVVTQLSPMDVQTLPMGDFGMFSDSVTPLIRSLTGADVDNDGDRDLIVAGELDGAVFILANDGQGNFEVLSSFDVGIRPQTVREGHFNDDENIDIAVTLAGRGDALNPGGVVVLTGDGNGQFSVGPLVQAGEGPLDAVTGDFNGDGDLDLAVTSFRSEQVIVLENDGSGILLAVQQISSPGQPISLSAGDVDQDDDTDLVVANYRADRVVLLTNENGTFESGSVVAEGMGPGYVQLNENENDGALFLGIVFYGRTDAEDNFVANDSAQIFTGDGSGGFTFLQEIELPSGAGGEYVTFADIDSDRDTDLLIVESELEIVGLYHNQNRTFVHDEDILLRTDDDFAAGVGPEWITVGQFDSDGNMDIIAGTLQGEIRTLLRGPGAIEVTVDDGDIISGLDFGLVPDLSNAPLAASSTAGFNGPSPYDTNNDGVVSAFDALLVINCLSLSDHQKLSQLASVYADVNDDGMITPFDALLVINQLETPAAAALSAGPVKASSSAGALVVNPANDARLQQPQESREPGQADSQPISAAPNERSVRPFVGEQTSAATIDTYFAQRADRNRADEMPASITSGPTPKPDVFRGGPLSWR